MKKIKCILSMILVCAMILPVSMLPVSAEDTTTVDDGAYLYTEDFSCETADLKTTGWGYMDADRHTVTEDQKLLVKGRYNYLSADKAQQWSNYTVEAEVTTSEESLSESTAKTRFAGIIAAATLPTSTVNNTRAGYNFVLVYAPDTSDPTNWEKGAWSYQLWDCTNGSSNQTLATKKEQWAFDTTYNLKMVIDGTNIKCYVNDVLKLQHTVDEAISDLTGTIAPNTSGIWATYDNIRVYKTDSARFTEDFSGTANDLKAKGWSYIANSNFKLTDGKLQVGKYYNYLCTTDAMKWSNYTVEAEVTVSSDDYTGTAATRVAGIVAAATNTDSVSGGSGYAFYLVYKPTNTSDPNAGGTYTYQLWNRTTGKSVSTNSDTWIRGTEYNMKMVINGTNIKCYVDDDLKIDYTVADATSDLTGTIATHTSGISATFDNIRVYNTITTNFTKFTEDFSGTADDLKANDWGYMDATRHTVTEDHKLLMTGRYNYLSVDKAQQWSNYTVEAEVTISKESLSNSTAGTRWAGIIAAATLPTSTVNNTRAGYNFVLVYKPTDTSNPKDGGTWSYQLWDCTNGTSNITLDEKEEQWAFDTTYNLKMVIDGTNIKCYVNDVLKLEHTVEGVTGDLTGTIAPNTSGISATFDNISVSPNFEANDYYDVSLYRADRNSYVHPFKEGKVFAGWYADAEFTTPLSSTTDTGKAYAKFVDENVLSVKAQLDASTEAASVSTDETTKMRFVTTVDNLDYQKVGFTVSTTNKTANFDSTTAYKNIVANDSNTAIDYAPSYFSNDSKYFITIILNNLQYTQADLEKVFTVTPYWVTADGTTVTGVTRNDITIQKGITKNLETQGSTQ